MGYVSYFEDIQNRLVDDLVRATSQSAKETQPSLTQVRDIVERIADQAFAKLSQFSSDDFDKANLGEWIATLESDLRTEKMLKLGKEMDASLAQADAVRKVEEYRVAVHNNAIQVLKNLRVKMENTYRLKIDSERNLRKRADKRFEKAQALLREHRIIFSEGERDPNFRDEMQGVKRLR